jgi:hypothetical protein
VVTDVQEEEWDREIEIFLQQLDDCQEGKTSNLEETLLVKEETKTSPPGLQELPHTWKYEFLTEDSKQPVIISSLLILLEEYDFVEKLEKDYDALVWNSDDVSSTICLPKMNKEKEVNSSVDAYNSSVPPLEDPP